MSQKLNKYLTISSYKKDNGRKNGYGSFYPEV